MLEIAGEAASADVEPAIRRRQAPRSPEEAPPALEPAVFGVLGRRRPPFTEERSAGDIHREMPDVTFGAVSLQLRVLNEAGLLEARREGRSRIYRARPEALGPLGEALEAMWSDALWRLKLAAELEATRRGPRPRRTPQPKTKGNKR